ncbi:MAG: alkaline phosphatase family protein [Candidatus Helarchaeota archaeon]
MQKIVMIMLDALGYDKISKDDSPFLYQLAEKSINARIKPLLAYRGIEPTIFSGLYPDKHRIWLDYIYDPKNSPFRWTYNPFVILLHHFVKKIPNLHLKKLITSPICYTTKLIGQFNQFPRTSLIPWNLLKNYNVSMNKSIIEKHTLGKISTLFDLLRINNLNFNFINFPNVHSDRDTMRVFRNTVSKKKIYNFNLLRFFDLDTIGHEFGPNSLEFKNFLRRTDGFVEEIYNSYEKIDENIVFLIISDHGCVEINRILNIFYYLGQIDLNLGKDYQIFVDSTMIRFYTKKIRTQNLLKSKLSEIPYGHFITNEEKKQLHIPDIDEYGDLIFLVESGTLILPNFYQGTKVIKGMHGYIPTNSQLDALFILNCMNFTNKKIESKIEFVDILPTILDMLKLNQKIPMDGTSLINE